MLQNLAESKIAKSIILDLLYVIIIVPATINASTTIFRADDASIFCSFCVLYN